MAKKCARVLLVEDHLILQKIMSRMLYTFNCEVDLSKSGEEALIYFESNDYQLILMDIGLVDSNGLDIAKKMLKSNNLKKAGTPIVIITAHSDENYKLQAFTLGIKDFIVKPCTYNMLENLLNKYIECRA